MIDGEKDFEKDFKKDFVESNSRKKSLYFFLGNQTFLFSSAIVLVLIFQLIVGVIGYNEDALYHLEYKAIALFISLIIVGYGYAFNSLRFFFYLGNVIREAQDFEQEDSVVDGNDQANKEQKVHVDSSVEGQPSLERDGLEEESIVVSEESFPNNTQQKENLMEEIGK